MDFNKNHVTFSEIERKNKQNGIPLIDGWQCQYGAIFNATTGDLSATCNIFFDDVVTMPITNFNNGSLSHYDPDCGPVINSSMVPAITFGEEKRDVTLEDIFLLTSLFVVP